MVGRAIKARGQVTLTKLYDGTNGAVGAPGEDGKTTYVHVAYSSSADGKTDFSVTDPSGRSYIGVLTDFTEKDSTNYSDYTWSLVKGQDGEDGSDGTPGKPGADGRTPYVHFSYANSADGKTDFSTTVYANKKFIGTLTDYTVADSTDYTKYTWSRLKGESGVGIANTVVEYQVTDTQDQPSEDSGWTSSIPNLGTGSYLWTRTTFFYTDGTTSRAYTISKQSDNTYTAVLTNDSITLPSDSNGKVTDFSNSTGNFLVYDGTYQVDSTTIKVQLVQAVNVTVTLGGNAYTITAMDSTKDTGYFDLSYTYKGVALTKRVSVSKSKSGANGTTPIIVNLSANAQVFTFDSNNHANPTSQNILFKTTVSGTTATPVYKAIPYDESGNTGAEIVMSNSGTNGKMLQVSQLKDYVSILVTASIGSVSDSTTIVRVKDGSSISPIPDPSNTVSSNTPPTDAKDGDWWNDTSQTPNVLKYRYRDKWVQYELDGYYVKANSISGEAIVTNTLEAQKIKYTNSNGTTTNLQTFDFSGMKTLLTDTKGNTYDSMDNAVSSTQSWTSLSKQVNNLGQVNQLFNTEFTPDFSGWFSGLSVGSGGKYTDGNFLSQDTTYSLSSEKRNGSNVINKTYGSGVTSFHSGLIPVSSGVTTAVAIEMKSSWDYNGTVTGAVYLRYYDVNLNYVSENDLNSARMVTWNRFYHKSVAPDNATYVVLNIVTNGNTGITSYSQPMMVFSDSIGSYVPGNYNNNARVLAIEKSASQFQVKISGDVSTAQSAADKASSAINNLSVGGRNYVQNSSGLNGSSTVRPTLIGATSGSNATITYPSDGILMTNGATNTTTEWYYQVANAWQDISKTPLTPGKQITFSADVMGTVPQAVLRYGFNGGTGGKEGSKNFDINNTSWTRVSITVTSTSTNTGLYFRIQGGINNQYANGWSGGETLKFRYVKIEDGNTPTSWTPAPEDVESGINSAKTSADSAKTKIDNLSVGGRNYLISGTAALGWLGDNNIVGHNGAQGVIYDYISTTAKEVWSYSVWSDKQYTVTSDGKYLRYALYDSNKQQIMRKAIGLNMSTDTVKGQIVIDDNSAVAYIRVSIDWVANGYGHAKLEKGNIPTDWSPSPEDINNDIENIQSSTNQLLNTNLVVNSEFDNTTGNYTGWHLDNPWGTTVTSQINKHGNRTTADSGPNLYPQGSQMVNHDWSTSANWIYSDPIPIGAGQPLSGSVTNANPAGSTTGIGLALYITSYDSNKNKLSGPYSVNLTTVHSNWVVNYFENKITPENTAYVSFTLGWNNGKAYFGQPMLQASSKYTGYIPGTPNSNMAIANAQSTANSAQTSADTANQNLANASKSGIRYIRLRSDGNSDNASTHFSEIKVFNSSGTNVLKGKPALLVNGATNTQSASNATDESYSTYIDLGDMRNSEKYVMFDMGTLRYDVNSVQISTYSSTRTYYGVVAQTSSDGISWSTIYRGNITPNQLIGGISSTVISFGMDTSTVLKLTADNYTLGIDANGNLISGITGNTQQVTLKGNVIHLDGNTVAGPDFFSLWNGKYGSTTIDSTGMEVRTGLSKTKFTNGNMQFITDLGENIGYIGRQVDSVHNNLDYLTFGLNGWHTTYPGDSHYEGGTEDFYGGDGILFGISNADGGYAPLLQWNSGLAASYKSSISGWLFTQPIVGGIDIYGDDYASNKTVSMRFQNVKMSNGFTYPIMTSQQATGSTGIVIGSGNTYILGGNSFVWSVAGNGYAYYNTQKRGSSGSSLLMASDGAIVAQTSATKYKSDIEYEPSTSYGDKLLTIDPATWSDKNEKEQIQKYKDTGQEPEYSMNKDGARYYGLIAEDMVKAGLEDLIVRNTENGSVEGIQYEKIGIALIPLLREQRKQINELRVEIERLKEKTNE